MITQRTKTPTVKVPWGVNVTCSIKFWIVICFCIAQSSLAIMEVPIDDYPFAGWRFRDVEIVDINEDGCDDMLIGGRLLSDDFSDCVIVWGSRDFDMADTTKFEAATDPWTVELLGDINADGYNDIGIGNKFYGDCDGSATIFLYSPDLAIYYPAYTMMGMGIGHGFGTYLVGLGDWNDDHHDVFAIGGPSPGMFSVPATIQLYSGVSPVEPARTISESPSAIPSYLNGQPIMSADIDGDECKELYFSAVTEADSIMIFTLNDFGDSTRWVSTFEYIDASYNVIKNPVGDVILVTEKSPYDISDPRKTIMIYYDDDTDLIVSCFQDFKIDNGTYYTNFTATMDLTDDGRNELAVIVRRDWLPRLLCIVDVFDSFAVVDTVRILDDSDILTGEIVSGDIDNDGYSEIFWIYSIGTTREMRMFSLNDDYAIKESEAENDIQHSTQSSNCFYSSSQMTGIIEFYDLTGRCIKRQSLAITKGLNTVRYRCSETGLYLYRVLGEDGKPVATGKTLTIN